MDDGVELAGVSAKVAGLVVKDEALGARLLKLEAEVEELEAKATGGYGVPA